MEEHVQADRPGANPHLAPAGDPPRKGKKKAKAGRTGGPEKEKAKWPVPVKTLVPVVQCEWDRVRAAASTLGLKVAFDKGQHVVTNSHAAGALLRLAGEYQVYKVINGVLGNLRLARPEPAIIVLMYPSASELAAFRVFAGRANPKPHVLVWRQAMHGNDEVRGFPRDTYRAFMELNGARAPDVIVFQDVYWHNVIEEMRQLAGRDTIVIGSMVPYNIEQGIKVHVLPYKGLPATSITTPGKKWTKKDENGDTYEGEDPPTVTDYDSIASGALQWGHSNVKEINGEYWVQPLYEMPIANYEVHPSGAEFYCGAVRGFSTHCEWVFPAADAPHGCQRITFTGIFKDCPLREVIRSPPILACTYKGDTWAYDRVWVQDLVPEVALRVASTAGDLTMRTVRIFTDTAISGFSPVSSTIFYDKHKTSLIEGTIAQAYGTDLPAYDRSVGFASHSAALLEQQGYIAQDTDFSTGIAWTLSATRAVDVAKRGLWTLWCTFRRAWDWLMSKLATVPPASALFSMLRAAIRRTPTTWGVWSRFQRVYEMYRNVEVKKMDFAIAVTVAVLGVLEEALKLVGWPVRLLVAVLELVVSLSDGEFQWGPDIARVVMHVWCAFTPMPVAIVSHFLFDFATSWLRRNRDRASLRAIMDVLLDQYLDDGTELEAFELPGKTLAKSSPVPVGEMSDNLVLIMDGLPVQDVAAWVERWKLEVSALASKRSRARWYVTYDGMPELVQPGNDVMNMFLVVSARLDADVPRPEGVAEVQRYTEEMCKLWPMAGCQVTPYSSGKMHAYVDAQPWPLSKKQLYHQWILDHETGQVIPKKGVDVKSDEKLEAKYVLDFISRDALFVGKGKSKVAKTRPIFAMSADQIEWQMFLLAIKEQMEGVYYMRRDQDWVKTCVFASKDDVLNDVHVVPADAFCAVWVPSFNSDTLSAYMTKLKGPTAFLCGDDTDVLWVGCPDAWFADMNKCDKTCSELVQGGFCKTMETMGVPTHITKAHVKRLTGAFRKDYQNVFEWSKDSGVPEDFVKLVLKYIKHDPSTTTGIPATSHLSFFSQLMQWWRVEHRMCSKHGNPKPHWEATKKSMWMADMVEMWRHAAVEQGHEYDSYALRPANGSSFVGGTFVATGPSEDPHASFVWVPTAMYKTFCVMPDLTPAGVPVADHSVAWASLMASNQGWAASPLGKELLNTVSEFSEHYTPSDRLIKWWHTQNYWKAQREETPASEQYHVDEAHFVRMIEVSGRGKVADYHELMAWLRTRPSFPVWGPTALQLLYDLRYA